jgi:CheY-like chemotaxis protein
MAKKTTTVLFIEDETIIALIATHAMREAGYSVDRASTGEEALEFFAQKGYDLIVSDVELGSGMDGIATTERILNNAAVPILFMTSHGKDEVDMRAKAIAGCYDYIRKDSDMGQIVDAIELCLQRGNGRLLFDYIGGKVGSDTTPDETR